MERPGRDEYVDYYDLYVKRVPDGDVVVFLQKHRDDIAAMLAGVPADTEGYRYAPDKWSIKDVVGHLIDAERCFAYRAMVFARADKTPLPPFEQDDYVTGGDFDTRTLQSLRDEFVAVRNASIAMFKSFDDEVLQRRGTASGFEFTVRAIAYIIAGHAVHHADVLRERYL